MGPGGDIVFRRLNKMRLLFLHKNVRCTTACIACSIINFRGIWRWTDTQRLLPSPSPFGRLLFVRKLKSSLLLIAPLEDLDVNYREGGGRGEGVRKWGREGMAVIGVLSSTIYDCVHVYTCTQCAYACAYITVLHLLYYCHVRAAATWTRCTFWCTCIHQKICLFCWRLFVVRGIWA